MIQRARLGLQQCQIMQGFKANLLVIPDPGMLCHGLTIGTQNDPVEITFGHDGMMGIAHRHRIIVPVKPHQRQGAGGRRKLAAGLERCGRQRQEGILIRHQQLGLGAGLPTQAPLLIVLAVFQQLAVEPSHVARLRHGHEVVQSRVLHLAFHHALLIAPGHPAKVMGKEVVAFELEKALRQMPFLSQDLAHRHLRVVVGDPIGHTLEKLERPHMTFPECLRAFALERHHKGCITVRQRHHEERHLAQPAIHIG